MKIIFLDIDGVLNGYNKWSMMGFNISEKLHIRKLYKNIVNPFGVHENKVRRLAKIVRKTGAKIVISSSWRFRYFKYMQSIDNGDAKCESHFSSDIQKLHKLFKKYNIEVIGITPKIRLVKRDEEIHRFLEDYKNTKQQICPQIYDEITNYIILDDENTILPDYAHDARFIQTSSVDIGHDIMGLDIEDTGLKNKHVKQAIEILNKI